MISSFTVLIIVVSVNFLYRSGRIDFYNLNNLQKPAASRIFAEQRPTCLCTVSPASNIMYWLTKESQEIGQLDCTSLPPKAVVGITTPFDANEVSAMCCVNNRKRLMLILVQCNNGLSAFNIETGKLKWSQKGRLDGMQREMNLIGVTTDGLGHLFVCDSDNGCIQMFSAADGRYMGPLVREGEQGLGELKCLGWCQSSGSLVVVHKKNSECYISVFKMVHIIK